MDRRLQRPEQRGRAAPRSEVVVDQEDPLAGELEGCLQGLAGALEGILAVCVLEAQGRLHQLHPAGIVEESDADVASGLAAVLPVGGRVVDRRIVRPPGGGDGAGQGAQSAAVAEVAPSSSEPLSSCTSCRARMSGLFRLRTIWPARAAKAPVGEVGVPVAVVGIEVEEVEGGDQQVAGVSCQGRPLRSQ